MELKFVATKKPTAVHAVTQRRQRLIRRIDQQISLIKSATEGMLSRTSWAWMDENGAYFLPIKYGRNSIELQKGMFAIQGDFDAQLQKASTEIRSKFSKK
ncbi:hypothetical protein [Sphingorhabdus sp.]|jgi:hypothetical protein|uniref:hypothetical protein n=1 Tax=Sphingorhabdus sp. TaxID=1902408 RepID=UPI00378351A0